MLIFQNGRTYPLDNGLVYVVPQQSIIDFWARWPSHVAEDELIKWAIADQMPGDKVFLDIGANVGTWTLQFALSGKCAHVCSWEPQRSNFNALVAGLALNDVLDEVTTHRVALGSPEQVDAGGGLMTLHLLDGPTGTGGQASVLAAANPQAWTGEESVKVRTLDAYGLDNIGLIKLDVEGNELAVLQGAKEMLRRNEYPTVFFECWSAAWFAEQKAALFAHLEKLDYNVHPLTGASVDDYLAVHRSRDK
jgi:FkbM family methyltransferase